MFCFYKHTALHLLMCFKNNHFLRIVYIVFSNKQEVSLYVCIFYLQNRNQLITC